LAKPRQIPLDLGHRPARSRDDLVVSEANRLAVELIEAWPAWPSNVVSLSGPTGSGKTHLATLWREVSDAEVLDASQLSSVESVINGAVLLDDINDTTIDETGLFHLFNAIRAGQGSLLLVSDRPAGSWDVRLPDLRSRLRTAASVEIGAPDDQLLTGVFAKLFADRQVDVEPAVVQYLIKRVERSLAEAERVVAELDRIALETKRPITRSLAASLFSEGES
jgi:chromosomal replication initiation ATPase DnaA